VIKLHPNPTSGLINLHIEELNGDLTFEVYTVHGEILFREKANNGHPGSVTKQLDFSSYPKGIYFVRILGEDAIVVRKVIRE